MGVPIVYRKSRENVLVNYDFVDISSGTGYVLYYAGVFSQHNLSGHMLSSLQFYSHPQYTLSGSIISKFRIVDDIDFDVLINKPFTFKGDAIVNIPFYLIDYGSTSNSSWGGVAAKIRKWDGTTETEIGSASGAVYFIAGGSFAFNDTFKITIPQTIFKKGDYLRLTAEGWFATSSGAGGAIAILHDPKDRPTISGALTGQLTLQMPVKLNL